MNTSLQELYGADIEEADDLFNFLLPEGDDEEAGSGVGSSSATSSAQPMQRTLEEEDDKMTWQWHGTAGKVLRVDKDVHKQWLGLSSGKKDDAYSPFASQLEWEISHWAVKEKVSQSSFNRLLKIPQVKEKLGVSFDNARSMLNKVDQIPERGGSWFVKQLSFKDRPQEEFTVRYRDPVEAIKALWGDPSLAKDLVYKPAKLFRNSRLKEEDRIFSEMWTGGFWNVAQTHIPFGGTVAPVILATDKTQLTQLSGSKSAYPVYLTIGNIPKDLRRKPGSRACILIAYLSVDKPVKKGLSKTQLKLRNYQLFHQSMAMVLEPLKVAGDPTGPGVEMVGGDGAVRRVYPLLATYVCDYPEQCLVTCTKYGTCPKCQQKADKLHLPTLAEPRTQRWTTEKIQAAKEDAKRGGRSVHSTTMVDDIAGGNYDPFWLGFPVTNIHRCIAPDVLHQMYQGVLKYLIGWVQRIIGEEELDDRIRKLPPTPGVRHFAKGISNLTQMSGTERKHIARVLLACLVGKIEARGITACRSLLHFIHLAQYPSHDQITLSYMITELKTWHDNRDYFISEGAREHFNIPKFHSLLHYVDSIQWIGTTDNCNTEAFERLHIDFAKEGWRASNKRDVFPQMVTFISRQEKVASFDFYQSWASNRLEAPDTSHQEGQESPIGLDVDQEEESHKIGRPKGGKSLRQPDSALLLNLAKNPTEPRKTLASVSLLHGAPGFLSALKLFLNSCLPFGKQAKKATALKGVFPFKTLEIWHNLGLIPPKILEEPEKALVKASPLTIHNKSSRFDTVIVLENDEAESTAVRGCRAARLRVIFRLPQMIKDPDSGFPVKAPAHWPKEHLAYVTWYSRFKSSPDKATGMYKVEPSIGSNGVPLGAVIPLSNIRQNCMLVPSKAVWDNHWDSDNILDECSLFFVNNLQSKYTYQTIY
ncbi:hypothetical protein C8R42DRAFT_638742 [Lentinula raphanica]|nr:hypothetical protein C8R42DRAFT_638742 [Lentinula raphanica]